MHTRAATSLSVDSQRDDTTEPRFHEPDDRVQAEHDFDKNDKTQSCPQSFGSWKSLDVSQEGQGTRRWRTDPSLDVYLASRRDPSAAELASRLELIILSHGRP